MCDLQSDCCDGSDETVNTCWGYKRVDFEQGLGGFQQLMDDQFNWMRHQGPTSTGQTGIHLYNFTSLDINLLELILAMIRVGFHKENNLHILCLLFPDL